MGKYTCPKCGTESNEHYCERCDEIIPNVDTDTLSETICSLISTQITETKKLNQNIQAIKHIMVSVVYFSLISALLFLLSAVASISTLAVILMIAAIVPIFYVAKSKENFQHKGIWISVFAIIALSAAITAIVANSVAALS